VHLVAEIAHSEMYKWSSTAWRYYYS